MASQLQQNAEAGPSSRPASPSPASTTAAAYPITSYLPPSPPPEPQIFFRSTDDLLRRFELHHAYLKYVTPYLNTDGGVDGSASAGAGGVDSRTPQTPGAAVGGLDKGKGKEMALAVDGSVDATQTPAAAGAVGEQDGDDDEQGGQGKKKKGYRHLIKGVPGRHSTKKDDWLATIMQIPPKQHSKITPFSLDVQQEAFSVSLEGLKNWNINTLIEPSPQAREDRKRRKEEKRRKQAQQAQIAANIAAGLPPPPNAASLPQSHSSPAALASAGTPRPGTPSIPRSTSTPQITPSTPASTSSPAPQRNPSRPVVKPAPVQIPTGRVGTPLRTAGGTSTPTGPSPLSAPPINASMVGMLASAVASATGTPISAAQTQDPRGKKRAQDEMQASPVNGINGSAPNGSTVHVNGVVAAVPGAGAKAGLPGARPRPVKKQRVNIEGHARETPPVQQPTPQGV